MGVSKLELGLEAMLARERAEKAERERDEARENAQHDAQKNVILKGYLAEAREDIKALAEIVRCGLDMDRIERLHPNGLWRPSWQRIRDRKLLDVPDGK